MQPTPQIASSYHLQTLRSPFFLGAVLVLFLNDFFFKAAFHNYLTGKLSDFVGLFVAGVLLIVCLPSLSKKYVLSSLAFAFVVWKMPLSQPFIDFWNQLGIFAIDRVVDYEDFMALGVLPLAYLFTSQKHHFTFRLPIPLVMLVSAVVCMASSYRPDNGANVNFEMPIYVVLDIETSKTAEDMVSNGVLNYYEEDEKSSVDTFAHYDKKVFTLANDYYSSTPTYIYHLGRNRFLFEITDFYYPEKIKRNDDYEKIKVKTNIKELLIKQLVNSNPYFFEESNFRTIDTCLIQFESVHQNYKGKNRINLHISQSLAHGKFEAYRHLFDFQKNVIIPQVFTKGQYLHGVEEGEWSFYMYDELQQSILFVEGEKRGISHYKNGILSTKQNIVSRFEYVFLCCALLVAFGCFWVVMAWELIRRKRQIFEYCLEWDKGEIVLSTILIPVFGSLAAYYLDVMIDFINSADIELLGLIRFLFVVSNMSVVFYYMKGRNAQIIDIFILFLFVVVGFLFLEQAYFLKSLFFLQFRIL